METIPAVTQGRGQGRRRASQDRQALESTRVEESFRSPSLLQATGRCCPRNGYSMGEVLPLMWQHVNKNAKRGYAKIANMAQGITGYWRRGFHRTFTRDTRGTMSTWPCWSKA